MTSSVMSGMLVVDSMSRVGAMTYIADDCQSASGDISLLSI